MGNKTANTEVTLIDIRLHIERYDSKYLAKVEFQRRASSIIMNTDFV